jgi:hypothetical protein
VAAHSVVDYGISLGFACNCRALPGVISLITRLSRRLSLLPPFTRGVAELSRLTRGILQGIGLWNPNYGNQLFDERTTRILLFSREPIRSPDGIPGGAHKLYHGEG